MIACCKTGFIGADIGTSTVKIVQLVRRGRAFEIRAMAAIPRSECWAVARTGEDPPRSTADQLRTAQSLQLRFRGRNVAASLPMALCDMQTLDPTPATQAAGGAALVAAVETLTQRPAHQFRCATWPAEPPANEAPPRVNLIAVAADWTDQLCEDIASVGWSCQIVDALPFCLARALRMVDSKANSAPVGAIDLGYQQATFCVVLDGRPVYTRPLKGCSQQQLLQGLASRLGVDATEVQSLLARHSIAGNNAEGGSETSSVVAEMAAEPLALLEEEICRTIDYLKCQRNSITPEEIALFGGGAAICGLADELSTRLGREVYRWRLDGRRRRDLNESGTPTCLFGSAIALSALAWEAPRCTM